MKIMFNEKNVVLILCLCSLVLQPTQSQNTTVDSPWDLLILAQGWPPSWCLDWLQEHEGACSITSPPSWMVHGIWAEYEVDGVSTNCNDSWPLDLKEITPILPEMDRFWKSAFETEDTRYDFWSHEWQKHGTCATILEPLNTQQKYFTQGLNWMKTYSMSDVLSESGILPSADREYHVEEFFTAIMAKLKVKPEVKCINLNDQQMVTDIRICFNRNLELTDCVRKGPYRHLKRYDVEGISVMTNCDMDRKIVYIVG